MKRIHIILTFLFCLIAQSVSAQFTEGSAWSYYRYDKTFQDETIKVTFVKYELSGSYEKNGKTYLKLWETAADAAGNIGEPRMLLGLREENGCVYANLDEYKKVAEGDYFCYSFYDDTPEYIYLITEENEIMLYNFNLNVGDCIGPNDAMNTYYIKSKRDEAMANGELRERFVVFYHLLIEEFDEDFERPHCSVISGIGSIDGCGCLLSYLNLMVEAYGAPSKSSMQSSYNESCLNLFVKNGTVIYKAPEYEGKAEDEWLSYTTYKADLFFGNLVNGVETVNTDGAKVHDGRLYDFGGRCVNGTPERGIYIKDGKKFVVK